MTSDSPFSPPLPPPPYPPSLPASHPPFHPPSLPPTQVAELGGSLATERRERERVNTALEKETSKVKTLEAKVRRRFSLI